MALPPIAPAPDDANDQDTDADDNVVVTIIKNGDGSYTVYAGDEPEGDEGSEGASEDDANAMGAAGAAPAPAGGNGGATQGVPADSIGAALKAAMDILQADKSSEGAPGNAEDQFQSGFSAPTAPTPATGPSQKY